MTTERFEGFDQWSCPTFTVTADGPIEIGLDGESMTMDPPLEFSIRPVPVRVRLPHHAYGYSPAARSQQSTPARWLALPNGTSSRAQPASGAIGVGVMLKPLLLSVLVKPMSGS